MEGMQLDSSYLVHSQKPTNGLRMVNNGYHRLKMVKNLVSGSFFIQPLILSQVTGGPGPFAANSSVRGSTMYTLLLVVILTGIALGVAIPIAVRVPGAACPGVVGCGRSITMVNSHSAVGYNPSAQLVHHGFHYSQWLC